MSVPTHLVGQEGHRERHPEGNAELPVVQAISDERAVKADVRGHLLLLAHGSWQGKRMQSTYRYNQHYTSSDSPWRRALPTQSPPYYHACYYGNGNTMLHTYRRGSWHWRRKRACDPLVGRVAPPSGQPNERASSPLSPCINHQHNG